MHLKMAPPQTQTPLIDVWQPPFFPPTYETFLYDLCKDFWMETLYGCALFLHLSPHLGF
jgi:hypothetical protein